MTNEERRILGRARRPSPPILAILAPLPSQARRDVLFFSVARARWWTRRASVASFRFVTRVSSIGPFHYGLVLSRRAAPGPGSPRPSHTTLTGQYPKPAHFSTFSRRRRMVDTVTAAGETRRRPSASCSWCSQIPRPSSYFAEVAEKFGVLGHLLLLHHLAEGSAVTGAVLADDPCGGGGGRGRTRQRRSETETGAPRVGGWARLVEEKPARMSRGGNPKKPTMPTRVAPRGGRRRGRRRDTHRLS